MSNGSQSPAPMGFRAKTDDLEMEVLVFSCMNPKCPCNDLNLYFYKADSDYKTRLFKIVLNCETWQLVSTELYMQDNDYPRIIHEFMDELDNEAKAYLIAGREEARSAKHVLRDDIDFSGLTIDTLVYYDEIYHSYEQRLIEYEGKKYIALDYYCPDPNCDCMKVLLTFKVVKDAKALDSPVLEYSIKFKTGKRTMEKKNASVSAQCAEALFSKFLEFLGEKGIELLEERYVRIKQWGKNYLQNKANGLSLSPTQRGPKVGRNEPCPCGSGKKYKRCCGQ